MRYVFKVKIIKQTFHLTLKRKLLEKERIFRTSGGKVCSREKLLKQKQLTFPTDTSLQNGEWKTFLPKLTQQLECDVASGSDVTSPSGVTSYAINLEARHLKKNQNDKSFATLNKIFS